MIENHEGFGRMRWGSALAIFAAAALVVWASSAGANTNTKSKPTDVPATVIAHLPLASPAGNQMVLQRLGTKRYLYIQQASKQTYFIVDITKPEFPSLVKREVTASDSTAGKLEMVGDNVAIAEIPDANSKTAIRSATSTTETVRILDLSDPHHPTTLQTFKNVTSILADGGRGIIYLTNDEGLWVLKHNRQPLGDRPVKKRPCTSEDSIAAMPPDCE